MRLDMRLDLRLDMRLEMRLDMCLDMSRNAIVIDLRIPSRDTTRLYTAMRYQPRSRFPQDILVRHSRTALIGTHRKRK